MVLAWVVPSCSSGPVARHLLLPAVNRLECKGVTYDMDLLLGEWMLWGMVPRVGTRGLQAAVKALAFDSIQRRFFFFLLGRVLALLAFQGWRRLANVFVSLQQ